MSQQQSGQNSQQQQARQGPSHQDLIKDHIIKMQQIQYFIDWIQENVSQIRNDLEIIAFKIIYSYFLFATRRKEGLTKLYIQLCKDLQHLEQQFLSMEIKKCIQFLYNQLMNNSEIKEDNKKRINDKFQEVFVSAYAYETVNIFINQSEFKIGFIKDIVQRNIKRKNPSQKYNEVLIFNEDYNLKQLQKQDSDPINFMTNADEINLFNKIDTFSGSPNQDQTFLNIPASQNLAANQPSLVYSVIQKSLMINDFIERKNLSLEHNHPSVIKLRLEDPKESITCVEISKGGNIVICGTSDSQIYLFDVGKIQSIQLKKFNNSSNQQNYDDKNSLNNSLIVNENCFNSKGDNDNSNSFGIQLRNKFIGHEDAITSISIACNEDFFISSSIDLSIRLWDIKLNTCLQVYKGHLRTIWNIQFAKQGFLFGSCSGDRTAMLWTTNKSTVAKVLIGHQSDVQHMEFFENLLYVATSSLDNTVKFWEIKTGSCLINLELTSPVISMNSSYSGSYFVTGQENGDIRLWNLPNLSLERLFHLKNENKEPISSVHLSFDESTLVINTLKCLVYYDIKSLKKKQRDILPEEEENQGSPEELLNILNKTQPVPKEIFEIPKNHSEKYLLSFMHMRNFIIVVSKQQA